MIIETLRLRDFRNYAQFEMKPHPGVNLLFGQNGSGKTNLLEAVHYCALGRSHRTAQDMEVVRKGAEAAACGVTVKTAGGTREIALRLTPGEGKHKQVFVERKRAARLASLMGQVQCVMFSPEDLQLIKEGPSERRAFLDMMLSQLSPSYFVALQQYRKALDQRNAILRDCRKFGRPLPAMTEDFERQMARAASAILPTRRKAAERLERIAAEKYAAISGKTAEALGLRYQPCLPEAAETEDAQEIERAFLKACRDAREEDLRRGTSSFGAHREDLLFTLMGREMKLFASQGQIRTAVLSVKLAQMEIDREESGECPVLLLDDVMSELDRPRRTHLLREITGAQTFVTCTDESDLDGCEDRRVYYVSQSREGLAEVREVRAGEAVPEENLEEPDFS